MEVDVLIVGAGAAGLMCAIEAGKRQRKTLVIDHSNKPGKKILMAGGGRCNFTNYDIRPERYLSHNPHFCKSALSRYTQWHFINLVKQYQIPFHEKTLGQLFCDNKSQEILQMLLSECDKAKVKIQLDTEIKKISQMENKGFSVKTNRGDILCHSLVIASGGLSIPTMGASPFGYKVAQQFGLPVWPTSAGLVPFTLHDHDKEKFSDLSGVSVPSEVSCNHQTFRENILFTHRGLSGPAILQISSYWQPGDEIEINLLPQINLEDYLNKAKLQSNKKIKTLLTELLPKRLIDVLLPVELSDVFIQVASNKMIASLHQIFHQFKIKPNATEGYRTAEVTLGGVDVNCLSSKTMEVKTVPGLYFIGEVLDVTGWLGGYNFQWAWSSGWAAGQVV